MRRTLHRGRVAAMLDGADLRYVTIDGVEVVRRLCVTVRDAAWGTPPVTALETTVRETPAAIVVESTGEQGEGDVAVGWRTIASIHAGGGVRYRVAVSPLDEFAFNRIGLCVLHPPETCAGRPYRAAGGQADTEGVLPDLIAPEHLPAFDRLEIDVRGLGPCRFAFTGDLFELEDQRNWADGSFKTYCTPLHLPLPQRAKRGAAIEQAIELAVPPAARGAAADAEATADAIVALSITEPSQHTMPELGIGLGDPVGTDAARSLRALAPAHLRVDLRAAERFEAVLTQAACDAALLGCPMFLALHLGADPDLELARLDVLLRQIKLPVARVLPFSSQEHVSTGSLVTRAREKLAPLLPGAAFAGGTDVWFVDLNRERPDRDAMDAVAWSITPQVHGDDELTMIEGLAAQTDQAVSAHAFAGDLPLLAGAITLRPRYNPHAPDAAAQALDPPPASIDPRQGTPFAAAWTAGSIAALARGGVAAATYFETVGPRGVVPADSDVPRLCGRVIGWATRWAGWDVLPTTSSAPLLAQALIVRPPVGREVAGLVVNLTGGTERMRLGPLDVSELQVESLQGGESRTVAVRDAVVELELAPWDVVRLQRR